MATTLAFKNKIDLPQWRPHAPAIAASAAGVSLAWDHRNDNTALSRLYLLRSATAFDLYDTVTDEWMPLASPALAGTFGAGATAVMHPSQGPRGTIAAGATTTKIVLSTALPAAVGVNQLANRGDGTGFRIRVIGNGAGSSGKIEERTIIGNTAGTTPTIILDAPLSFTPATGDGYEFLSGRVFLLSAGALAAGVWKYYDVATNSYSGNLATTNLPATIGTDSNAVGMSELHVPCDRKPGEGFVNGGGTYDGASRNSIQATAATATTIAGSGMPADLLADEYRNFQIRIVEDTVNPAAVGQRRTISTHTSGAAGVFTIGTAWTVNPSTSAKFVVENNDDLILLRSSATTSVYAYKIGANAWDTTSFAAAGAACGAGVVFEQCFGVPRDPTNNRRHSHLFCVRGGASNAIDMLDIAAAAAGAWSNAILYGNQSQTFTTGTSAAYDPVTLGGKYLHLNVNGTQRFARFNMLTQTMEVGTYLRFPQSTAVVGGKLAFNYFLDGATKLAMLYHLTNTQSFMFSNAIQA